MCMYEGLQKIYCRIWKCKIELKKGPTIEVNLYAKFAILPGC